MLWKNLNKFFGQPNTWQGLPADSDSKESACNVGDSGSIPGSERSPGEGNGSPLQYSWLENSMEPGIPEEPGWLWSTGSQRVGQDWATNTYIILEKSASSLWVHFLFLPSFIFRFNLIILSLSARADQLHFSSYVIKSCLWKSRLIGTIFSMYYNFILAFHPEAQDASPSPAHLTSEAGLSNRVEICILTLPIFS